MLVGDPFDLVWLTFCAAHVAGHQFWDLSQLDAPTSTTARAHLLGRTLDDVYAAVDAAIGRVVAGLPRAPTSWSSPPSAWT